MLRKELRIISARMRRVPANRRPQYTGLERMAILQLRAMRGWNKSETSRHFLVSDDTIRDWLRRVDDCRTRANLNPGQSISGCCTLRRSADQTLLPAARQVEDRREAGPGRHVPTSCCNVSDGARD
jgi:transposase-like protein